MGKLICYHDDCITTVVHTLRASDATTADRKTYPAMSQEEVEEWLSHIPVFAVTDSNGAGVVLRPDENTSVFYFFMSPVMANSTLETLKSSNEEMDLRISAFSLGKIWYKILNAGKETEVQVGIQFNVSVCYWILRFQ